MCYITCASELLILLARSTHAFGYLRTHTEWRGTRALAYPRTHTAAHSLTLALTRNWARGTRAFGCLGTHTEGLERMDEHTRCYPLQDTVESIGVVPQDMVLSVRAVAQADREQ